MENHDWERINRMVIDCTEELFLALGIGLHHTLDPQKLRAPNQATLAVIGFAGSQLRGSLILNAPSELLNESHPSAKSVASEEDLRDWAGELANQLIGRIKNRLLTHNIVIQLSTPTTLSGVEVRIGNSTRNTACIPHRFESRTSWLHVRFESVAESNVALSIRPQESASCGREGDVLIF